MTSARPQAPPRSARATRRAARPRATRKAVGERGGAFGGHGGEDLREARLGGRVEGGAEPVRLALDEAGEEGRAAGGAFEELARRAGEVAEAGGDVGQLAGVVRARAADDAVGEGARHRR